jgi:hypothetical protein
MDGPLTRKKPFDVPAEGLNMKVDHAANAAQAY